ncbi:MAG: efflux RND transporter periplasmic adaptor subunit [Fimbriimonadales bacterium]|nr:efflux RND transporter periplasmic adaptor subunit [Fimbriimonadales bacterium]
MMRKASWLLLAIVAIGTIAFFLVRDTGPPQVEVGVVTKGNIETSYTAAGVVKGQTTGLSPRAAGTIESVLVTEGQHVRKGDTLIRLNSADVQAAIREAQAAQRVTSEQLRQIEARRESAKREIDARIAAAKKSLAVATAELKRVMAGPQRELILQAEQRVEQARAQRDQLQSDLDRARRLFAQDAIARAELEAIESRLRAAIAEVAAAEAAVSALEATPTAEEMEAAKASVSAAEANVKVAESGMAQLAVFDAEVYAVRAEVERVRATIERISRQLDDLHIKAPTDGVIAKIDARVGEYASPLTPVIQLSASSSTFVEAEIADQDSAKVFVGQAVEVTTASLPGRTFRGEVVGIAPEAEIKPDAVIRVRILRARVIVDDAESVFRVGMEVDVSGIGVAAKDVLVISSDAVFIDKLGTAVWVIEDNFAKLRRVRLGFSDFEHTEVLDGLKEGETVVTGGKDLLSDGMNVQIRRART